MTDSPIFRKIPPWSIVVEVLTLLKLPTDFPITFQKTDINMENTIYSATLLEPFYKPCKARKYLDYIEETTWITILRHCLIPHGYTIISKETTRNKKKAIFYNVIRLSVLEGPLRGPVSMDFS